MNGEGKGRSGMVYMGSFVFRMVQIIAWDKNHYAMPENRSPKIARVVF